MLALVRKPVPHLAVVNSQPLAKFFAVTAAANHLGEIARQKDQEPERPKEVVQESYHSRSHFSR